VPPRELLRRFWPFARPYRLAVAAGVILVALLPAAQAAEIWMFKLVVDEVIAPGELGSLPWIAAAVVAPTIVGAVLSFGEDYAWTWAGERFLLDLRATFFSHFQRLSFDTLDRRRLGYLASVSPRRGSGDARAAPPSTTPGRRGRGCASSRSTPRRTPAGRAAISIIGSTFGWRSSSAVRSGAGSWWSSMPTTHSR
jgi:ABC transporter transmembrane region